MADLLETEHNQLCTDFTGDWSTYFTEIHNKLEKLKAIGRSLTEQTT
jgi:hypothetical protein